MSRHWFKRHGERLLRQGGKSVKFAFIEAVKASFPISRMCHFLGVSKSGFFAWQDPPACRCKQQDMVYLAHIRTAFALSNGTYGSPRMHRDLVARNPGPGLVHHSDRGSQYCLVDDQALLRRRGSLISMSGRGNCCDNSMVETFFRTIKSELIWPVARQSRQQAENALARYIGGFYDPVRRHSSRGFQSPIAFDRKAREVT